MEIFVFVSEQWMLVSLLLGLIYLYFWSEKVKSGPSLSMHAATRLVNSDSAVLIDLRETAEYQAGHIVDAISVPHNKLDDNLALLEKHKAKTLILVDKIGAHAGNAGRSLRSKGFEIGRLEGGMTEWVNQKLPVVK